MPRPTHRSPSLPADEYEKLETLARQLTKDKDVPVSVPQVIRMGRESLERELAEAKGSLDGKEI